MKIEDWDPYYSEILDYFGFSREDDDKAAQILANLLPKDDIVLLQSLIRGHNCLICGNSPSLPKEVVKVSDLSNKCIIAADAASRVLNGLGYRPDIIFSDIDGMDDDYLDMNEKGTVLVLHAHGDNIPLLKSWVPKVKGPIVGTTQSTPLDHVYNFGGFTDGDRCVFCADELGAKSITIIGFDLDDRDVDPLKHGKLMVARKLLHILGYDL